MKKPATSPPSAPAPRRTRSQFAKSAWPGASAPCRLGPGTLGALLSLALPLLAQPAWAYCRTTTCDSSASCSSAPEDCCQRDSNGCDQNGTELSWPSSCISWAMTSGGSDLRGIDGAAMRSVIESAFGAWSSVSCSGSAPSFSLSYLGPISCGEPEYNENSGNANVWMMRDDGWSHSSDGNGDGLLDANALALTTVSFNYKTAEVYDADVEFNSQDVNFTTGDANVSVDLLSVATHEAGHFLGLDHSKLSTATMYAGYKLGSVEQRSLSTDDEAGICEAYPANRSTTSDSCEPQGGFSKVCGGGGGCNYGAPALPQNYHWGLGALLGLWVLRRARARSA